MDNFLKNKPLLRGLLFQGDQWHTINGGVAQLRFSQKQHADGFEVRVHVPSLSSDFYQIAVQGANLIIQTVLPSEDEMPKSLFKIPMHQRIVEIPASVDVTRIDAVHDEGGLRVWMPFAEGWSGEIHPLSIRDEQ